MLTSAPKDSLIFRPRAIYGILAAGNGAGPCVSPKVVFRHHGIADGSSRRPPSLLFLKKEDERDKNKQKMPPAQQALKSRW